MQVSIQSNEKANQLTLTITGADWAACLRKDFYQGELSIQEIVAAVGRALTAALMADRDETASPLEVAGTKYYRKTAPSTGHYKTPYGDIAVERHRYETAHGGATLCPMEHYCPIGRFGSATPLLAEVLAFKVSAMTPRAVAADSEKGHRVTAAPSSIWETAPRVGQIAVEKKETWELRPPETETAAVAVVATGMDGTTMPIGDEHYKMGMVGTIALYEEDGERIATEYLGAMPEAGQAGCYRHFAARVERALAQHPSAEPVVRCDGERTQWEHLETKYPHAIPILDFCPAAEQLSAAADLIFGPPPSEDKTAWYERQCRILKEEPQGAARVLREWLRRRNDSAGSKTRTADLEAELTYFRNNAHRMD